MDCVILTVPNVFRFRSKMAAPREMFVVVMVKVLMMIYTAHAQDSEYYSDRFFIKYVSILETIIIAMHTVFLFMQEYCILQLCRPDILSVGTTVPGHSSKTVAH